MTSSLSSKARLARSEADQSAQAATALLAFSVALVGTVVVEALMRLTIVYGPGSLRYWAITLVNGTLLPICALSAWWGRSLGGRSILVSLGAFATLWAAIGRFRGLWVWSGTLDAFWLSPNGWSLCALGGFALGSLSLLLKKSERATPKWVAYAAFGSLGVAALVEYAGGRLFASSIDSVYAETRHLFIAGVAAVLATGYFFGETK